MKLAKLATARSGDKGNHANIGVIARDAAAYALLQEQLTAERVADHFHHLQPRRVDRFLLPHVQAMNFLLYDALQGGASQALQIDTQGKLLGTDILELEL